jgi:hypothetical protein
MGSAGSVGASRTARSGFGGGGEPPSIGGTAHEARRGSYRGWPSDHGYALPPTRGPLTLCGCGAGDGAGESGDAGEDGEGGERGDGEGGLKKTKKKKKKGLQQTDPPTIPIHKFFPSGIFPEGEIQQYDDRCGARTHPTSHGGRRTSELRGNTLPLSYLSSALPAGEGGLYMRFQGA